MIIVFCAMIALSRDGANLRRIAQAGLWIRQVFGGVYCRGDYANYHLFSAPNFGAAVDAGLGSTAGTDQAQNKGASTGLDWTFNPRALADFCFVFFDCYVVT